MTDQQNLFVSGSTVPHPKTHSKVFRVVMSITEEEVEVVYKIPLKKSHLYRENLKTCAPDLSGLNTQASPSYYTPHITRGEGEYPICVSSQVGTYGDSEILVDLKNITDPNILIKHMPINGLNSNILMIDVDLFNELTKTSRKQLFRQSFKEIWICNQGI